LTRGNRSLASQTVDVRHNALAALHPIQILYRQAHFALELFALELFALELFALELARQFALMPSTSSGNFDRVYTQITLCIKNKINGVR
jgi:hypothetical protein